LVIAIGIGKRGAPDRSIYKVIDNRYIIRKMRIFLARIVFDLEKVD
jgi:hypothetical protein